MKKSQIIVTVICYIIFIILWIVCGFLGLAYVCLNTLMPEWIKLLFVILVLGVITYPIYSKQINPERAYTAIVLTIVTALLFYFTHYGFFKYYSDFTPSKWYKTDNNLRGYMINSLEEKYNLLGMTKKEIIELLGTPDYSQNNEYRHDEYQTDYYEYIINYVMIDPVMYRISFDSEKVVYIEKKVYN